MGPRAKRVYNQFRARKAARREAAAKKRLAAKDARRARHLAALRELKSHDMPQPRTKPLARRPVGSGKANAVPQFAVLENALDVGCPEETKALAWAWYCRLLETSPSTIGWRDYPVTKYRQRCCAANELRFRYPGSVGRQLVARVLGLENLDQACSSCDERQKVSYEAVKKYASLAMARSPALT